MHILVAEDDRVSLMLLEAHLGRLNHTFVSTRNGRELLDTFTKSPNAYDVVITDVMMPFMNGLEAIREIKKINNIVSVATTACDQETKVIDNKGVYIPWSICDFFLRKPFKKDNIKSILQEIEYENYIKSKGA